jgi:hypothetical protein
MKEEAPLTAFLFFYRIILFNPYNLLEIQGYLFFLIRKRLAAKFMLNAKKWGG